MWQHCGDPLRVTHIGYSDLELSRVITPACVFVTAAAFSASYGPADRTDLQ
jgi:hypothetical protein